jgi:UTP--glucose-1-phosphate uridylyltransferase
MTVRTAVIPAAGLGTRMLPATEAVPKELLPVGGRPAIDWVLEEAWRCGIERAVIVTGPHKPMLEWYLHSPQWRSGWLPRSVRSSGIEAADEPRLVISIVEQSAPRGLGDAVRIGWRAAGHEPVAVLLPDELMLGGSVLLSTMIDEHARTGASVVSLITVPEASTSSYGCALVEPSRSDGVVSVIGAVEKPAPGTAPSRLAFSGRYVLAPEVYRYVCGVESDAGGEIQLTPALDAAARQRTLVGHIVRPFDGRLDVGNWSGWLTANSLAFAPSLPSEPFALEHVAGVGA